MVPLYQRFRGHSFVWFVLTSLIWNRSPRSSFLHDPQCVTFPHEKSQSICVSVVAELFNGVLNELALLLGRANNLWILQVPRNVFCPLWSICFPFVESWLKHNYFFANTFSLSASKAAKNALQPFWIQTGCRRRLNIFVFHPNDCESFQEWRCVRRSSEWRNENIEVPSISKERI